jgi:protocatechuate 3,4-dioxygenase beta subunit
MQGIELDLYLDGTQISTSYADVNGDYAFNGLLPGSYSVKIKLPQGRVETYEPDGTLDGNIDAVLAEGQMIGDRDFGVYKLAPATIGNTVWNDANDNGIQDASEKGIAGITLALFDAENIFVKTTTTDSNGSYLFDGLDPGTYHIKITGMAGYDAVSPQDTTPDTDGNCDFDKTGVSYPVTVVYEQDQLTIDAGLYKYASLSNKVWLDTNKDGRIDNGEKGIPGVTVTIIDPNGVPLASTVTDANGNYRFDNLAPGKYHVKVTSPGNLNFEDNKDMIGGQSGAISLQSGQAASNVDTGLIRLGNPQTGDSSRDVSWLLVLISAAVGLLAGRIRLMGRRIRRSLKGN